MEVRRAAAAIGVAAPRAVMVDGAQSPMLIGALRPVLVLSAPVWQALGPRARHVILRHEHAHLRRRDPAAVLVGRLGCAFCWWNPLLWWLWRDARRAAELATDAMAVRPGSDAARVLARALLEVERLVDTGVARRPAGIVCTVRSAAGTELAQRLTQLTVAGGGAPVAAGRAWLVGWSLTAAALGAIAVQIALG